MVGFGNWGKHKHFTSNKQRREGDESTEWTTLIRRNGTTQSSSSSQRREGTGIEGGKGDGQRVEILRSKGLAQLSSNKDEATGLGGQGHEAAERETLRTGTSETIYWESSSITDQKPLKIAVQGATSCVAFLGDGQRFVSGDVDGKIRYRRTEDGQEVRAPIDVGSAVRSIATSQDGQWIVAGTESGQVVVLNAKSRKRTKEMKAHGKAVKSIDISPDGTKFATVSDDKKATLWSLPACKDLGGRMNADYHAVKFSPDSTLVALALLGDDKTTFYLGIFDSQDGTKRRSTRIHALSIAWASDGKQLFILSPDADIHCLDALSLTTLSTWSVHSNNEPACISLSRDSTFIAASADSSVSFWEVSTRQQIGSVIRHPGPIECMDISQNYDLVITGRTIELWDLLNVLSAPRIDEQPQTVFESTRARPKTTMAEFLILLSNIQRTAKQASSGLEKTVEELRLELAKSQQIIRAYRQKHECEALFANGHISDAANSLLDIKRSVNDDVKSDTVIMDWLSRFTNKCIVALELIGEKALEAMKPEEALATYATALSLGPSTDALLTKWASMASLHRSRDDVLDAANKFGLPRFVIYRTICDSHERCGRVADAIKCFREMQNDLASDTGSDNERQQWELDFRRKCSQRLEKLVDAALGSHTYDEADKHLSTILSLDLPNGVDILIKRSDARAMMESWEDALKDADKVIEFDRSSHRGFELRHAALHGMGRHGEAVSAFDTMLAKLLGSPDARVRELYSQYADARPVIRRIIDTTISHMPRVLIDTTTGRLLNRTEQANAFEALPIFDELVSSMTREIDHTRIRREVKEFYRYVMFSHRWERGEPLFQQVMHVTVYKLEASHGNLKLQTFCSLVRQHGFRWAWSDTCCIDKDTNAILQESLIAMFAWYRGSSLTIVHLCDVSSLSEAPDGLRNSIWNTRVWTHQEYVAAERVLFYTQDWKPYLGLTLDNHKLSPVILRQMEVPQVSTEQVAAGLDRVREKLYLASMRETTLPEDIAYSLLGILNASIPVIYGEGTRAVGRLLEYVLTGSGDATILAWNGIANEYNSCLPMNLTVYNPLVPPHIPHMETIDLDHVVSKLRASLPDLSLATALYDRLIGVPSPTLASSRLQLPCICFPITKLVCTSGPDTKTDLRTYHVTTDMLGEITITTTGDLTLGNEHCLVHPWIRPLRSQEHACGVAGLDKTERALRLVARLKQRFGALLFEKVSWVEYKRAATDSLIMVQIRDEVSLTDLVDNIDTIEVL